MLGVFSFYERFQFPPSGGSEFSILHVPVSVAPLLDTLPIKIPV
jgi:hypothetical protein